MKIFYCKQQERVGKSINESQVSGIFQERVKYSIKLFLVHETLQQNTNEITEVNRQKCVIQNRFYHFFVKGELSALGKQAGFQVDTEMGRKIYREIYGEAAEEEEYFDHDNWYCVFKK
ncbi:Methyltransferase [Hexamita inflata]|uniref:Methyltransferase n=1 Tax=Hexamita inflata TaxID=28002 RepID=A0AA86UJY8_9EUKA|nr:Methyltransferase [Hexamita inflata]